MSMKGFFTRCLKNDELMTPQVVKNATWLIGCKVLRVIINLVVGVLTARYLGPSNYGLINYAAAYTVFFSSICSLGINSVLVKEFVDRKKSEGTILGTTFIMRWACGIMSVATIWALTYIIDRDDPTARLVVLLASLGMFLQTAEELVLWFRSRFDERTRLIKSEIVKK